MKTEQKGFKITQKITLKGESGGKVEIDLEDFKATEEQKSIMMKFLNSGDFNDLTSEEKNKIKDLKLRVGGGSIPMTICRFDWTWFDFEK